MNERLEKLIGVVNDCNSQTFIVIDGAVFDNIEIVLEQNQLDGRAVFHERAPSEILLAGPWLISPQSDSDVRKAFELSQAHQTGVVWCAPSSGDVIRRHLRTLNVALLPKEGLVYFRHYDPDVLASVCPLMDGRQAARLLGPSTRLGFLAGRGEGASVQRPSKLPEAEKSPLSFYDWQVEQLEERQRDLSRKKICKFLRHILPQKTNMRSDDELYEDVMRHESAANAVGLDTESSITKWAHLSIISDGEINRDARFRDFLIKDGVSKANEKLDENFFAIIRAYLSGKSGSRRAEVGSVS